MTHLFVDDMLITRNHSFEIENLKDKMNFEFDMIDLDKISYFLGIKFLKDKKGMVMHKNKYARELLNRYLCNNTLDIFYVVSIIRNFTS